MHQIDEAVSRAGVFDVHEHLLSQEQRARRDPDLFAWIAESYLSADLVSAGMDPSLLTDETAGRQEKWNELKRFLPAVRHTEYMEICRCAWRDLLGLEGDLDDGNWRSIDEAIQGRRLRVRRGDVRELRPSKEDRGRRPDPPDRRWPDHPPRRGGPGRADLLHQWT